MSTANDNTYSSARVFFDPWINPEYYYTILPLLPLIFEKIFVYYPSDKWISTRHGSDAFTRTKYRDELIYWIEAGVIIPVSKGDWPNNTSDIPGLRLANQGPSEDFLNKLQNARLFRPENWLSLSRDFTSKGRDLAAAHIKNIGGNRDVSMKLKVTQLVDSASPLLAKHYSELTGGTTECLILETLATYENDDLIRETNDIGHYLTPDDIGYQYSAYHKLKNETPGTALFHTKGIVVPSNHFFSPIGATWIERQKLTLWRQRGLHSILRSFLHDQLNNGITPIESDQAIHDAAQRMVNLQNGRLATFANSLEPKLASLVEPLLSLAVGVVSEGIQSNPLAETGKALLAIVGKIGVRQVIKNIQWDRFIDLIERKSHPIYLQPARATALAMGKATIIGKPSRG